MTGADPVLGAVLTGGASRRMGTDKALLEVAGVAMARRVADTLRSGGAGTVLCIGGDERRLTALGLDVVADRHPGSGPLGGVCTALDAGQRLGAVILVLAACDQFRLEPGTIATLVRDVAGLDPASTTIVVARGGTGHQPLPMALRIRPVGPLADALFEAGERSLRALLERAGALAVPGVDPLTLVDADRPCDLPQG